MCLLALLAFCLVLTGVFFIAPLEAEAAEEGYCPTHTNEAYVNGFCSQCLGEASYQEATLNTDAYDVNGDGESDDVYEIGNAGQLYWFADKVNNDWDNFKNANAVLTDDIVVNENVVVDGRLNSDEATVAEFRHWSAVGYLETNGYYGVFDGQGYTVSGLYHNDDSLQTGLFASLYGTARNVGVVNSYLYGDCEVAAISGNARENAEILNCFSINNVLRICDGGGDAGGIVGYTYGDGAVRNCYAAENYLFDSSWESLSGYDISTKNEYTFVFVFENCYYLAESETDIHEGTAFKTAAQFASGEVAYLLGEGWGQTLSGADADEYPVLGGAKVNYGYTTCDPDQIEKIYTNSNASEEKPGHTGGTATCEARAICDECGVEYGNYAGHIPNNDDGDCTTDITCSVCGDVTTEGNAEHTGGTAASCTTDQVCTKCGTVLVEALDHDFENQPWTNLGESGHAHQCSRCDEYDDIIPHYSEDEATCTTPKTCDSCGYVMEPSGDHSFTEEIADTAHLKEEASSCVSGAAYWYDCAYCDEISDTLYFTAGAQGAHSFDEDGFCTLCDGVEAPYYNENRDINGDGTPDGAYEVSKVGHLYWFPSNYGEYIDGNVFLMNDIVVNENVLLEDGSLNASAVESFRIWKLLFVLGEDYVFDGNGKFISGLYLIDYDSGFGVGGLLGENHGIIKNLTVKNSYLEGYEFGSIVYYNGGIVENCHSVNNTLVSKYGGGGVVGINYGNGTIKDCTNSSNLYVENGLDDETYEIFLGGIVAIINEGEVIKNCVNYGTITATANGSEYIAVGGIIGGNNREDIVEITNCHNKGNIIVQSITPAVGGVVGLGACNQISDCTNTGNITVDANYEAVGGIVGVSRESTIERCYNAGDIEINAGSNGYLVAGIAGLTMYTTIVNSYNVGNIEVTFDENFDENNAEIMTTSGIANIETSLVYNCYNVGEIIIPAEYQSTPIYGGVILLVDNDTSSLVENNYYLNATANEYGGRTAEQFASGEVAYALCKQIVIDEEFTIDGSAWGQTIGTDLTPVFDGDKVYAISHCANNATLYANDQSAVYILTKTDAKESTCQVQGNNAYWTCSICNKVYADENCTIVTSVEDSKLDLADHDWSATWDYEDEDGHAHKCLTPGCNEISTLEDHVEGAPATEDDPQLCTECGYVITPATGHVNHVSSGEYGYDENSHWFKCTGCDTYKIDQTAHQFDNACDVDCICGYQRTIEHDYTELKFNDTHHWYECSVCGAEQSGSRVAHNGGDATCVAKAICSCGQSYGGYGSHRFGQWQEEVPATCVATGTKAHKTCSTCEKHFAEDGVTEINDLTIAIDANNHDIATEWTGVENGHYHKCKRTGCEYHTALEDHQPDRAEATEDEPVKCSVCEYIITPATGHTIHTSNGIYGYDANGHWFKCVGCESEKVSPAEHSFDNDCDTDCACGYVRTITHNFTGEWQKDENGHWHVCATNGCTATDAVIGHTSSGEATEQTAETCTVCGFVITPATGHITHTPEAEWQKNETHHWHECTGCDGQELDKAAHNDGNNDGSCDACGYAMSVTPPSHTHAHGSTWVTDANEHWNECECGDKANKAAHVDDNGDNKCDTCDYTMPAHYPDTPPVDNPPTDDNDGLGTGAIIGIVVAAVAVVGGGGFAIFWFVIRKKRR